MGMTVKILIVGTVLLGLYLPSEAKAASEKDISVTSGRESQSIPESKFREIFYDYLHRQLGKNRSDIVLSSLKVLGNKPVPKGAVSFQVFQNDKRRLAHRCCVPL